MIKQYVNKETDRICFIWLFHKNLLYWSGNMWIKKIWFDSCCNENSNIQIKAEIVFVKCQLFSKETLISKTTDI